MTANGLWFRFFAVGTVVLGTAGFIDPNWRPASYLVVTLTLLGLGLMLARIGKLNGNLWYLWPGLMLAVIGAISFVRSRVVGSDMSYGAALVPLGAIAAACIVPVGGLSARKSLRRFEAVLFALVALALVLSWVTDPINHQSMMIAVIALALFAVDRRWRSALLTLVAICVYSVMRPSSTVIGTTALVVGLSMMYWGGHDKAYYMVVCGIVICIVLLNIVAMFRPTVIAPVMGLDSLLKGSGSGGGMNGAFRLGVIRAASQEFLRGSVLLGKGWTGSIDASGVRQYVPWWRTYQAPIHSDFATVIQQGGVFGICLFSGWWIGILLMLRDGKRRAMMLGDAAAVTLMDATVLSCGVVAVFLSFNPVLQQLGTMMAFYVLLWLAAMARIRMGRHAFRSE